MKSASAKLRRVMHGEYDELVRLAVFAHQRAWRQAVGNLPAGDVIGLAET
jgi:hypothetical protein